MLLLLLLLRAAASGPRGDSWLLLEARDVRRRLTGRLGSGSVAQITALTTRGGIGLGVGAWGRGRQGWNEGEGVAVV